MDLAQELHFRKGIAVPEHEALLGIYHTGNLIKKEAAAFFRQYAVTDVQFNVLILLTEQTEPGRGLSQVELSRMMLVNRANVTAIIDRMERAGWVRRAAAPEDRRLNLVSLTARGRALFATIQKAYIEKVRQTMSPLSAAEQRTLVGLLARIREPLGR